MTDVAAPEWISGLADESLKTDPSIQSFKTVDDLAKSFISTKALVGKKGVVLPAEGADEKEWVPVWDSLGRPKTADDYKMPNIQLKHGMQLNEEEIKAFREHAHAIGMPQKHFEKIMKYRLEHQIKQHEIAEKKAGELKTTAETSLRQKWGSAYDEKISGINKLLKSFGGERGEAFVQKYGADADVIAILGEILPHLSESTIGNLGIQRGGTLTPEEAKSEISKIRNDEKHPFNLGNHPDHAAAVAAMDKLYQQAHPGKKAI